jgi:hypothetical protein
MNRVMRINDQICPCIQTARAGDPEGETDAVEDRGRITAFPTERLSSQRPAGMAKIRLTTGCRGQHANLGIPRKIQTHRVYVEEVDHLISLGTQTSLCRNRGVCEVGAIFRWNFVLTEQVL